MTATMRKTKMIISAGRDMPRSAIARIGRMPLVDMVANAIINPWKLSVPLTTCNSQTIRVSDR